MQGWRGRSGTVMVWVRTVPIDSCIYTLGFWLMALFGKVMELLGGTALLMEVHPRGQL